MTNRMIFLAFLFVLMMPLRFSLAQSNDVDSLKAEAVSSIDSLAKLNQEIIDSLFSFAELGFQEFETQRYLTEILEQNDFEVELGIAAHFSPKRTAGGEGVSKRSQGHRPQPNYFVCNVGQISHQDTRGLQDVQRTMNTLRDVWGEFKDPEQARLLGLRGLTSRNQCLNHVNHSPNHVNHAHWVTIFFIISKVFMHL